jgi:RIO-like serine/threonine protein kinase
MERNTKEALIGQLLGEIDGILHKLDKTSKHLITQQKELSYLLIKLHEDILVKKSLQEQQNWRYHFLFGFSLIAINAMVVAAIVYFLK